MKSLNNLLFTSCAVLSIVSSTVYASPIHTEKRNFDPFSFALIGDTPYKVAPGAASVEFDRMQLEINNDEKLLWVVHAGDIKSGSTKCTDELFYDRLNRYNNFEKPFLMTLGDNEWTDCHRVKAGEYQPLERLSKLRTVFFSEAGQSLGQKSMRVETQASIPKFSEFPENVMWQKNNVVFSTVHVVGSQNGLKAFDPASSATRTEADDLEVQRRIKAAVSWINTAFDLADKNTASGVFFVIQANPLLELKWLLKRDVNGIVIRKGFTKILQTLEARTAAFGKPVVLAHGDSHYFRVDKPELPSATDGLDTYHQNFSRVETFGSSKVHWVKVNVNPNTNEVFQFKQMIVSGNK